MKFDPVFLPGDRRIKGRASQTFLRHFNLCPRSGFLYALHKGEAQNVDMIRGSALHAVYERATNHMVEAGEVMIPAEIVKDIVNEVLADPDFSVPLEEHDYMREQAFRWAAEFTCDPEKVIATETLFVLELAGYDVRMKIDFAESLEDGAAVYVIDYKTGRGAHTQEEVARVRPDRTLAAKNFQLVLYAIGLAWGVPVRVEKCPTCGGRGWAGSGYGDLTCRQCEGRGHLEYPEPFPVAQRAQRFDLEFVYPGIENREQKMLRRPMTLTRAELTEYRLSLESLLTRLAIAEDTGDWPAVVSDAACGQCPASLECPLLASQRDYRGAIIDDETAAHAASILDRSKRENAQLQKMLRERAKANGGEIRYGGKVWRLEYSEHEEIPDKETMFAAVERALRTGEPFDKAEFIRVKGQTNFKSYDIEEGEDDD